MVCVQEGIQRPDTAFLTQCCSIIDSIAGHYHACLVARDGPPSAEDQAGFVGNLEERAAERAKLVGGAAAFESHLGVHPGLFSGILSIIFSTVVMEDCTNQWSMSRPLLALVLACPQQFTEFREQLVMSQVTTGRAG